jgi:lipopolysaccharide export system protein LptA
MTKYLFHIYLTRFLTSILFTAGLFLFSQNSWAIKLADEEITISADYMQLNVETGNSTFTGNVEIAQGNLTLTGAKVILKRKRLKNGESEVDKLTITGHPARYNHITNKGKTIKAESEQMVYTAKIGKLVMTTNARLTQPENQVSSQKIVYDTFKKIVIAGAKKPASASTTGNSVADEVKPNQRVKITLTPRKK